MEKEFQSRKNAFWNTVSVREKTEADLLDRAKGLLACSTKQCKEHLDAKWLMSQKSIPKTPHSQKKHLEKLITIFDSLEYRTQKENTECVFESCVAQSKAFFEARKAHMIAEARTSIARIELMEAAKKRNAVKSAKKK